jgi:hypothetical protein
MATAARDIEVAVASLSNQVVDYPVEAVRRATLQRGASRWAATGTTPRSAQEGLHHALQDRLRARRAAVAAALAEAQDTPEQALEGLMSILQLHERDARWPRDAVARPGRCHRRRDGIQRRRSSRSSNRWVCCTTSASWICRRRSSRSPGPLDEDEWRIMRTHPQVGYDLLRNQPRFADAAEMVLAHHEAYDGTGYPRRLDSHADSRRPPRASRSPTPTIR